jgi:hypothetical protein
VKTRSRLALVSPILMVSILSITFATQAHARDSPVHVQTHSLQSRRGRRLLQRKDVGRDDDACLTSRRNSSSYFRNHRPATERLEGLIFGMLPGGRRSKLLKIPFSGQQQEPPDRVAELSEYRSSDWRPLAPISSCVAILSVQRGWVNPGRIRESARYK